MGKVRRVYAEKKKQFAVPARQLRHEIRHYLGISGVTDVRVLIRYDVENISDSIFEKAVKTVFSEPPVDDVYEETFPHTGRVFSVEFLPGQFDQRADSAVQCVKLLKEDEEPVIRTATTYVIDGEISDSEFAAIKAHCINPVDSRETSEEKPESLAENYAEPADVKTFDHFISESDDSLKDLYESLSLAMTFEDFLFIRNYFRDEEHRDPTVTEIRVLDTYWSDHCRHTTFLTELKHITFEDGLYKKPIEDSFKKYQDNFKVLYKDRNDKYVCLMDIALLAAKQLKAEGKLSDQEESNEINACSIVIPVEVDGVEEEWLLNFKNETHNHPTEIEPFGGAATCLGGAIRDPLSGRTYVYQAMRVTGAADPTVPNSETMEGKLPQKKLCREAAHGYSSYGNQIGLATGYVKELYHPNYAAKRMEIGAVLGAAPRRAVQRLTSDPGDRIILLGGRTGRDGIGGATGSSKAHNTESTAECGAEVQKGNAPTERKLQRLFRREEVAHIIKKCNDFGAGGVSVAIGELADGLVVDLDKVPKKYAGLDGTELAISESQERMAVVVAPEDEELFMKYAAEENLEATDVAVVTEEPRLILKWRGKEVVNLSRAFMNTNGAHLETEAVVSTSPTDDGHFFDHAVLPKVQADIDRSDWRAALLDTLSDLNSGSQKGLVEMFDSSIGAGTILMPYGGKYQLTETQAMAAKIPVQTGESHAASLMAYGFDPYLSSASPYHGAVFAVTTSMAKIVAAGGDPEKIRFTFQEYFGKMDKEHPKKWGAPLSALLGAYEAQLRYGLPSIGGKDSSSGSFNDMDVPPTLVSFAVDTAEDTDIISPEFKAAGDHIVRFRVARDAYELPEYDQVMKLYNMVYELIMKKVIKAAYVQDVYGLAKAVVFMAMGNHFGAKITTDFSAQHMFAPQPGSFVCEIAPEDLPVVMNAARDLQISDFIRDIGEVTDDGMFTYGQTQVSVEEAIQAWQAPLEEVFHTKTTDDKTPVEAPVYENKHVLVASKKNARPKVFIPVFPGTNCEYDSARAFEKAGAEPVVKVFRNLTASDITESVEEYARAIDDCQMIMFPGGFSAGDEPEGSAKFYANAFRNEKLREAVMKLVNDRDGLVLGICNGFQALIKLGLVPYGEIGTQTPDSPTLTYNTLGRHISHMVYTKVVSNKSPWLLKAEVGKTYVIPASHGEGRFAATPEWIKKLEENGQIATRYSDPEGNISTDEEWNVNGSFAAIEGITSPDGRIFGKMCHAERIGDHVAMNIYGDQDMHLFESGVEYFK